MNRRVRLDRRVRRDGPRLRDLLRDAASSLRLRWLRATLCALGIALGVAAVVDVLAIPASTQRALLAELGRDGNLLTVASGATINNQPAPLPATAPGMVGRIAGVQRESPTSYLTGLIVRRSAAVPVADTNGVSVLTATPTLPATLGLRLRSGRFLDAATARYPTVVLGSGAARSLGMTGTGAGALVYLSGSDGRGGLLLSVLGILDPAELAPELDSAALIGPALARTLGADDRPTRVYLRTDPDRVAEVQGLLAPTARPTDPGSVSVSRPSDLLVARATTRASLAGLAFGLGGVALLVGGVGVANVMIVSVLERRTEIGLRRALGATRGVIALLFLAESTVLCLLGAAAGGALGVLATVGYATTRHIPPVLPLPPLGLGLAAALIVGLAAGSYPALRAARLPPSAALRAG